MVRTELVDNLLNVMGDRIQLQQVFMNLILNGIDAMKDMHCGRLWASNTIPRGACFYFTLPSKAEA
jgi:signal transduction histidine kinase